MKKQRQNNNKKKSIGGQAYQLARSNNFLSVQRPLLGFIQPRLETTLKYNTSISISTTTGIGNYHYFSMNSIFDPDVTGTGHQPYGHDTLAALYKKYKVLRFRYHVEFTPSNDQLHVGVLPSNGPTAFNPTTLALFSLAAESPYAKSKTLSFDGGVPVSFEGDIPLNMLIGQTIGQYISDDLGSAEFGGSPTETMYFTLFTYNPSGGTVTTSVLCTFWFKCVVWDPILIAQS